MGQIIEAYVERIVSGLKCGPKQKKEIAEELAGHLQLLVEEFKNKGFKEEKAISLAIAEFGDEELISEGMQNSIMPGKGVLHWSSRLFFGVYSFLLLWNLILFRFIDSSLSWDSHNPYFQKLQGTESFFNAEIWQLNTNIIPFFNTYNYITGAGNFNLDIIFQNTLGNVLIFVPFGILLGLTFRRFNTVGKIIRVGFTVTITIELTQFFLQVGQFDIDDILLNTVGTILGYGILKACIKMLNFISYSKSEEIIS